jgi:predicted RNA binding protein YcfA (HicA-like mRNA interferase family)
MDQPARQGSHGTLYYGDRKTIVKDRKKELSRGLLADMLRQLGLGPRDLDQ